MTDLMKLESTKSLVQVHQIIKARKKHEKITHGTVKVVVVDHVAQNGDLPCSSTSRCFRIGNSGRFHINTTCVEDITKLAKASHDAGSNTGEQKEYVLARKLLTEKRLVKIDDYGNKISYPLSEIEVPEGPKFRIVNDSAVEIQVEDGSYKTVDLDDTETLKGYFPQKTPSKYKFDMVAYAFNSLVFKLSCKSLDGSEPNVLNSSSYTVIYCTNGIYSFVPGSQLEIVSKEAEKIYPNFTQIISKALFHHKIKEIYNTEMWNYFCTLLVSSFQPASEVPKDNQADHVALLKAGEVYCYEIGSKNFQKSISQNLRATVPKGGKMFSADGVSSSQVTLRLSGAWKTVNFEYEK